jgi:hypothetical protein
MEGTPDCVAHLGEHHQQKTAAPAAILPAEQARGSVLHWEVFAGPLGG